MLPGRSTTSELNTGSALVCLHLIVGTGHSTLRTYPNSGAGGGVSVGSEGTSSLLLLQSIREGGVSTATTPCEVIYPGTYPSSGARGGVSVGSEGTSSFASDPTASERVV